MLRTFRRAADTTPEGVDARTGSRAQQQQWDDIISTGFELLGKLGQALQTGENKQAGSPFPALAERNGETGAPELRIPLPDGENAEKLGALLSGLGELLKGNGHAGRTGSE